jgi:hypothetical protein
MKWDDLEPPVRLFGQIMREQFRDRNMCTAMTTPEQYAVLLHPVHRGDLKFFPGKDPEERQAAVDGLRHDMKRLLEGWRCVADQKQRPEGDSDNESASDLAPSRSSSGSVAKSGGASEPEPRAKRARRLSGPGSALAAAEAETAALEEEEAIRSAHQLNAREMEEWDCYMSLPRPRSADLDVPLYFHKLSEERELHALGLMGMMVSCLTGTSCQSERDFSRLSYVNRPHRSSMKNETVTKILNIRLNKHVLPEVRRQEKHAEDLSTKRENNKRKVDAAQAESTRELTGK